MKKPKGMSAETCDEVVGDAVRQGVGYAIKDVHGNWHKIDHKVVFLFDAVNHSVRYYDSDGDLVCEDAGGLGCET